MRIVAFITGTFFALAGIAWGADDFLDRVDDALTVTAFHDNIRVHLSGTLDLETYWLDQPALELVYTERSFLFNPRLTVFLDGQLGPHFYVFAQSRLDRGFDPSDGGLRGRVDEYAVRYSAGDARNFNVQVGRFATVVGNWTSRHLSWSDPFITAPLPYAALTGVWDAVAAGSSATLVRWGHVRPDASREQLLADKYYQLPILWGPVYTSGLAISGDFGRAEYALEIKNASLSSRPEYWETEAMQWRHPTFSGRVGLKPNEAWRFGFSASSGPYLDTDAIDTIPSGHSVGDYREIVLGQDVSFAWRHFELWAEVFETRFTNPNVGDADTIAYYLEAKYKFTPQFSGALRWNEQAFGTVVLPDGQRSPWGRDTWRIDAAWVYRFTPHTQLKLQYSLQHQYEDQREYHPFGAAQFTVRF